MTPEKAAAFRAQILAEYPIGSEWYVCGLDDIGTVVAHFPPRGIMLRMEGGRCLSRFTYTNLLDGSVIKPRDGGWYHQWHAEQKRLDEEYEALRASLGGDVWC